MEHLEEGQLLIVRETDKVYFGKYKSYAFKRDGSIVAAVENDKLLEAEEVGGEFVVVKGGNLHPRRFDEKRYLFFAEQPHEIQEQFRNRNAIKD